MTQSTQAENNIVMLLSNSFRPDPRVLKEANYLQRFGFKITILGWDRNSDLSPEETLPTSVKIIRIQNVRSSYGLGIRQMLHLPRFWLAALRYLPKLQPALVHCHDFDTLPAGLWFGKINHIPVIYDAHEYYAELVRPRLRGIIGKILYTQIKWSEQYCASKSRAVITVDENLASIYRRNNKDVIIIGHYPEAPAAEKNNPIFSSPELSLIYAGRLSRDRGLLLYVDILRKLIARGIPSRLLLAGSFSPDREKSIFYDYAKDVSDYIDYKGWITYTEMTDVYHSADIGLAILLPEPRYVVSIPVKLFEYMANGLPVIASNFPAIAKIVNDAGCGILVDPLALNSKIINTISEWWNDRTVPRSIGENGRQAVLKKYTWENQAIQLVELYQKLT